MRLGQKNQHTRRWARRGSRPVATQDLRTASAYLFGALCPERGTGAAGVMPRADTEAMQGHLEEIARAVAPGTHAVMLLEQAGWHTTPTLHVPGKPHPAVAAAAVAGAEPGRKPLAVPASDLPVEPRLRNLRGHPRRRLQRLERRPRHSLAHHVHQPPRLDPQQVSVKGGGRRRLLGEVSKRLRVGEALRRKIMEAVAGGFMVRLRRLNHDLRRINEHYMPEDVAAELDDKLGERDIRSRVHGLVTC